MTFIITYVHSFAVETQPLAHRNEYVGSTKQKHMSVQLRIHVLCVGYIFKLSHQWEGNHW